MAHYNYESLYYLPLDCEKGMDLRTREIIPYDGEADPETFKEGFLCKFCKCFCDPDSHGIGVCKGFDKEEWAYGDCGSFSCEKFARN
ncbi:4-hydroxyphenylacetate decarboxylase, regulatory subunit [Olsenella uli DSM 7084]|uniref:4-hydroxyphenylacetate decarboxylase small subunit n=1 Tax=Olsenella uli (strain ATCC 49627 / DSM 7084 / CCUG 31166 / CIP 109912 / JCM 12494 / LMG 11480 / NCIMB 702895 / VPI D76D-27C) TaxID=633147 RepID=E1QVI7_OLSUV|nr:4-hydroxyphenylacetate decarboxylase small subunit [Olsenella uli]ADK68140.1 4-hydroxyphenylacetate decarboxylase, regulatory subunit [Olsenella uli DSM 7084]EUB32454.1 hypothetical protein HMPREF1503_1268 [Olsenella uli MSTE5]KRO13063.1 4-hydroxyphenylacetate decarboxylase, regulatory subunit [Olsenella uli DSM 7084]MBS6418376.1 4-hydroxyphenylacetate decarboxylase small subunit [Olsenella uli]